MNWSNIWMSLFGTTDFLGLDLGFWVSMAVVAFVVIMQHVIFWPKKPTEHAMAVRLRERQMRDGTWGHEDDEEE